MKEVRHTGLIVDKDQVSNHVTMILGDYIVSEESKFAASLALHG